MQLLLTLLLYPGLLLAVLLALVFGLIIEGRLTLPRLSATAFTSAEGLTGLASLLLAALALALLPWPAHPSGGWLAVGSPVLLWTAIEGAFLLPLLPGLLDPSPLVARAAVREAQMGVAGRAVVWLAIGAGLWEGAGWRSPALLGHVLVLLAGALAFPAAAGIGPFGAERSLNSAGAEAGLDDSTASLLRFVRLARAAVLLAALIVASLPPSQPWGAAAGTQTFAPIGIALVGAVFLVVSMALRQVAAALPRFTLPGALRWCWTRALPFAVVGLVYLALVR